MWLHYARLFEKKVSTKCNPRPIMFSWKLFCNKIQYYFKKFFASLNEQGVLLKTSLAISTYNLKSYVGPYYSP